MAVITSAVAAVVTTGVAAYSAYQGYQSAQDAKANLSEQEYARYQQAMSIDDQLASEESLYEEEQGLLEAENAIAGDKLDLANEKALSALDYKGEELGLAGEKSEEGMKAGLEKTLMQGAVSFKQAQTQGRQSMAVSGFAGAGVGQEAGMRDAMSQVQMAQQAQTRQYGQEQSMLAMQQRQLSDAYGFQETGYDLSQDALAQQYERDQFGASKDYERAVGSLEARQQELSPGYTSGT